MKLTSIQKLEQAHDAQAASIVSRTMDNENWELNANDILWLHHDPQVKKQLGRSSKVFFRLLKLVEKAS